MIKLGCILNVSDNTGINKVKFIGTTKKRKSPLKIGDIITGSIQKTSTPNYKKSSIILGVLIKTKTPFFRKDGTTLRFFENSIIILDKTHTPKGTHIFGPVPIEIKYKYKKLTSLTNNFI